MWKLLWKLKMWKRNLDRLKLGKMRIPVDEIDKLDRWRTKNKKEKTNGSKKRNGFGIRPCNR